jgi:hypothetical protein
MKKSLLTILSLAVGTTVVAQQTPSPSWTISQNASFSITSAGIRFMDAVDASTVWLVGYDGTAPALNYNWWSKTTNGGTSYTSGNILPDTNTYVLANLEGIDGNTAWVSSYEKAGGNKGSVFKTINGGANWVNMNSAAMYTNTASFLNIVSFLTPSIGITMGDPNAGAGNEFEIWRTTNAGTTWSAVPGANIPNPLAGEFGIVNRYCKQGTSNYWFGTNKNRMFRSTDAGITWSVTALTSTVGGGAALGMNDMAFTNANYGLASAYYGPAGSGTLVLYNTTDGGATWNEIPAVDPNFGRNDFCPIPGTSWYASAGAGAGNNIISFSSDNGVNWNSWGGANIQYLTVDFVSSSVGWAGSFSSPTLVTQDGVYKYNGANLFQPVAANAVFSMTTTGCTSVAINVNNTSAGAPVPNYTWSSSPAAGISNTAAVNPSITFTSAGVYTISLAANNGSATSTTSHTITITACGVGIAEHILFDQNIVLYPNPASDKINIEAANLSSYTYKITNLLGKVVLTEEVNNRATSIDISGINKGIYFLSVESNGQNATRKIIIQ